MVLRHKLTMHTAFAREDNSAPAAITSLLVSKYVLLLNTGIFDPYYKAKLAEARLILG